YFSLLFSIHCILHDSSSSEIHALSLHDALPIYVVAPVPGSRLDHCKRETCSRPTQNEHVFKFVNLPLPEKSRPLDGGLLAIQCEDRKSTRLNSSHVKISYAVFCLNKKITTTKKS